MKRTFNGICTGVLTLAIAAPLTGCFETPMLRRAQVQVRSENVSVLVAFSDTERRIINQYYEKKKFAKQKHGKKKRGRKGMPPGLAKRDRLPPGLERQLKRNGRLPSGLESTPLPPALERDLPALPSGFVRVQIGGSIVLLNQKTRVVLDFVQDIDL